LSSISIASRSFQWHMWACIFAFFPKNLILLWDYNFQIASPLRMFGIHFFTLFHLWEWTWVLEHFSIPHLFGALNLIMSSKLGLQQFSNDLKKVQFEQGLVFDLHWSKYLGHLKTSKSQIGNSFENFKGLFFTFSQSSFSLKKCVLKNNHSTLYYISLQGLQGKIISSLTLKWKSQSCQTISFTTLGSHKFLIYIQIKGHKKNLVVLEKNFWKIYQAL
jgi:hypothetical protein